MPYRLDTIDGEYNHFNGEKLVIHGLSSAKKRTVLSAELFIIVR